MTSHRLLRHNNIIKKVKNALFIDNVLHLCKNKSIFLYKKKFL